MPERQYCTCMLHSKQTSRSANVGFLRGTLRIEPAYLRSICIRSCEWRDSFWCSWRSEGESNTCRMGRRGSSRKGTKFNTARIPWKKRWLCEMKTPSFRRAVPRRTQSSAMSEECSRRSPCRRESKRSAAPTSLRENRQRAATVRVQGCCPSAQTETTTRQVPHPRPRLRARGGTARQRQGPRDRRAWPEPKHRLERQP